MTTEEASGADTPAPDAAEDLAADLDLSAEVVEADFSSGDETGNLPVSAYGHRGLTDGERIHSGCGGGAEIWRDFVFADEVAKEGYSLDVLSGIEHAGRVRIVLREDFATVIP